MALVAAMLAAPAGAAEAGTESAGAEGTAPSTGWVQGEGTEAAESGGSTEVRRGSSLGSGAVRHQTEPTVTESPPPVAPVATTQPETVAPVSPEEPATSTQAVTEAPVAKQPVAKSRPSEVLVGTVGHAVRLTPPPSAQPVDPAPAPTPASAPSTGSVEQRSAGSSTPLLILAIIAALALAAIVARLCLGWLRHKQRLRSEAVEWQTAMRQIRQQEAPARKPGRRLRTVDLGADFVLRKASSGEPAEQVHRPAKKRPVKRAVPAKAK